MKDYNKDNAINLGIGAFILLTVFFVIATFTVLGGKYWGLGIMPTIAAGYGCYALYKNYHRVTKKNE